MIFSYNWLKEFVEVNTLKPHDLARALTMSGVEVEGVRQAAPGLTGAVTASILSVAKHPNADRLSLCEVSTGSERLAIVCGATNMKAGDKVALALHGAVLPGGQKIKRGKIRGVESQGMLMSEVEMGIATESSGIMILPPETAEGQDVVSALGLDDFKLDVGITPNRPDLLSVRGMAREISAVTGAELIENGITVEEAGEPVESIVKVVNNAPALCRRYMARVITGVNIAPSPEWLRKRLEAHGLRAINNVVDITNYVLLELGQPLHAFDLSRVGNKAVIIREALAGERVITIDGKERELEPGMLVIADSSAPLAIAGVMGGKSSEVTDATTDVLLESALFEPSSVRKTSKRLGLSTDSSYRFERGVDPAGVEDALDRAGALIAELASGKVATGRIDVYAEKIVRKEVPYDAGRASRLLGMEITKDASIDIFRRLGMKVHDKGDAALSVEPPSYRLDIKEEIDLIEEVVRLVGYDRLPFATPLARLSEGVANNFTKLKAEIKRIVASLGFYETINLGFCSQTSFELFSKEGQRPIRIKNPLSDEHVNLRASLLPGLLENLRANLASRQDDVRLFELAPVFFEADNEAAERWTLGIVMAGSRLARSWNQRPEPVDFFDIKAVLCLLLESLGFRADEFTVVGHSSALHTPGCQAAIKIADASVAVFGALHPDILQKVQVEAQVFAIELDVDAIKRFLPKARRYSQFSRFPRSSRDIAFIVDKDIANRNIISAIKELETKLIEKVELFDVYSDKNYAVGKQSIAIRITYGAGDRTLTHEEVDAVHAAVGQELVEKFGAEIRAV